MKIIDFRLRPPLRGFLDMVMYTNAPRRNIYTRQLGLEPAASAEQKSMDLLLDDMRAVNVVAGVVTARVSDYFGSVSNDDVAAMCKDYPGKLYGLAAVDPTDRKRAIQQIDAALAAGFKGVTIEPGAYPVPLYADDRRLYPIYAHLEDCHVPTVIMTGGNAGPDLSYSDPVTLDRVAGDFPNLRIVVSHGNWPWVTEILHVAYRRTNVSLSPDMYFHNMPGMDDYLKAANSWMAERFFFATAYPLAPLKEYTEWFVRLPLKPENMERIVYRNAAELLGIQP
jgi:uncharacterized protein